MAIIDSSLLQEKALELQEALAKHRLNLEECRAHEERLQNQIEAFLQDFKLTASVQEAEASQSAPVDVRIETKEKEWPRNSHGCEDKQSLQTQESMKTTQQTDSNHGSNIIQNVRQHAMKDKENVRKDPISYMMHHVEEIEPTGPLQKMLLSVVSTHRFNAVCSVVILANTVTLMAGIQYSAQNYQEPDPKSFGILETCFLGFYMIEAAMRMGAYKRRFFVGMDCGWHWFDLCMILCAVPDRIVAFSGKTFQLNPSFLRAVRITKMLKFGRIGRLLKGSMHMRLLLSLCVAGVGQSLPVLWSVVLCMVMLSLCILSLVTSFLQNEWQYISPRLTSDLHIYWGSIDRVMHSCFMTAMGGADWNELTWALREVGTGVYVMFLLSSGFFALVVTNIVTAFFVHVMLVCAENADKLKVILQLQRAKRVIRVLQAILGANMLTYEEFYLHLLHNDKLARYITDVMGTIEDEAESVFYILSSGATEAVAIEDFVNACIELKSPPTKIDLMRAKADIDTALELHHEDVSYALVRSNTDAIAANGVAAKSPHIEISRVDEATLLHHLQLICDRIKVKDRRDQFLKVSVRLVEVVKRAKGGCGFVVTTHKGLAHMQNMCIDFQVVDRKKGVFPDGYMTERIRDYCDNDIFSNEYMEAMLEFSAHSDNDRWPEGHEAHGLPKDGYTIMSASGRVVKAAVRIVGLPTPPWRWDGVGTRHIAALAASWVLRLYPSVVIVRSEGGKIHALYAYRNRVTAMELSTDVEQQAQRSIAL